MINISDMATPKSSRRVLKLVNETNQKKNKQIHALQKQNRKLRERVSILEKTIECLEQKNRVTTGDDTVVVSGFQY